MSFAWCLLAFPVGLGVGAWAYDHGWRAQSPFYRVKDKVNGLTAWIAQSPFYKERDTEL